MVAAKRTMRLKRIMSRWWVAPWAAGLGVGLLVLGPALAPGSLLNLDLVVLPENAFPAGFWGLGQEVPRPLPLGAIIAGVGALVGHVWFAKAVMVVTIAGAFAGMFGLMRSFGPATAWPAAFLYVAAPFLVTRVIVGHSTIAAAFAILPWVLPRLSRPEDDLRRTFLAGAALAISGFFGGVVGGLLVLIALMGRRPGRWPAVLGVYIASQIPWLVPGLVVTLRGPDLGGSGRFPSDTDTVGDALRLLAGHGFWQERFQVGAPGGVTVLVIGVVVFALAVVGTRSLPEDWRGPVSWGAGISLLVVVGELLPGGERVMDELTSTTAGAVLRETQRLLGLYVLWMAPAAVLGARAIACRLEGSAALSMRWVPAGAALVLISPAVWGADQLDRFETPDEWHEARALIAEDRGPVLVLPWNRYLDVDAANGRLSFNPMAAFLPGDVIISPDLGLDGVSGERVDPRNPDIEALLPDLRLGIDRAPELADVGVRWVVILHEARYQPYLRMLDDPGLTSRLVARSIDVLEVNDWRGPAVDPTGMVADVKGWGPWRWIDDDAALTWNEPYAPGWMRGFDTAGERDNGLIELPQGRPIVWFWPGVVVSLAYLSWAATAFSAYVLTRGDFP